MFKTTARRIIAAVAHATEIPEQTITSRCRTAEAVDARHIAIAVMSHAGIYPAQIAGLFGMTPRGVRYIIASFGVRTAYNPALSAVYETIRKQLGSNWEATRK